MSQDYDIPDAPADHEHLSIRESLESGFQAVSGVIKASLQPLPTQTGDGSYIDKPEHSNMLKDLSTLRCKDLIAVNELVKDGVKNKPIDDSEYLMEKIIQIAAELPANSKPSQALSSGFVDLLWNDISHPPRSFLGGDYKYRSADGSFNNIRWPKLGAAGTPYARTVQALTPQPFALPDPGVIFDSVMARKAFIPHPNKLSSVLFYLAVIIIHDCFRTDRKDVNISTTSSYLDLSPLYGNNQSEQDAMRTFQDGKIKPDCFSEKRILGFPPGVGVLMIMFNRFHNYTVAQLALINEGGRFRKPTKIDDAALKKYDNDLFQTARLITCGLYINIILKDYVRVILNLHRTNSVWDLDPRSKQGKSFFAAGEGVGNQVSAEFNLIYRWHAAISERDEQWTDLMYRELFPDQEPSDVSWHDLVVGLGAWEDSIPEDPQQRTFDNIPRGADGNLDDQALVDILTDSIEDVAGSFGANRVPHVLRSVEILGIMQARSWNMATLNEFRAYFNLKKHEKFEDINPDPHVADQLRHLYDHPDLVELYPGIVVESAKAPMDPGSGLCPGFTISRAILSDAVSLVRGDRFYTIDYTPKNLTNWGFNEVNYDVTVDQGHVFYKLFLRAFPNHFQPDSVYAHYPLVNPEEMRHILKGHHQDQLYTYERPSYVAPPTFINSYAAGVKILSDKTNFKITWGKAVTFLMENDGKEYGSDFMLSGDAPVNADSRRLMQNALYKDGWYEEVKSFYENITLDLLRSKSYKLAGVNEVDFVRDVGNLAHVHFSAEVFNLPLKTESNPLNPYSEQELYMVMALVFICIFFDLDPAKSFPLRNASRKVTQDLGKLVEMRVRPLCASGVIDKFLERFHKSNPLSVYGTHMIVKLLETGLGVKDIVWSHMMGTAGGMVAIQGQLIAQVVDFYLDEENKHHLDTIRSLAKMDTEDADDQILHYFMEGARLRGSVALPRDVQKDMEIQDGGETVQLKQGERVVVNLVACSRDPAAFPHPETVDLTRPLHSYIHYGWGPHQCLGMEASKLALATMLKTVARLDNLRRAPGPQGNLKRMAVQGGLSEYLQADGSAFWPFPTTMKIRWDGELPESRRGGSGGAGGMNGHANGHS